MGYKINQPDLELNLAPMIDVVFLLLIFFIVASTLNLQQVKKDVQLPTTKAVKQKKKTGLSVAITKQGKLYVGKKQVSWQHIEKYLTEELNQQEQQTITIFADKKVAFQQIVRLMDIAKQLPVNNLSFVLRRTDK